MPNSKRTNPFLNRQPLSGTGREAFLARIRKALNHTSTLPPANIPAVTPAVVRQCDADLPQTERVSRWSKLALANGIKVHPIHSSQILPTLDTILAAHPTTHANLNLRDLGNRFPVASHLADKNITVHQWGEPACKDSIFHCQLSITDCRAGLADAGSFLVWSDSSFGRASTLVVPVHIILIGTSQILPDLVDGLAFVQRANPFSLPSNVVVINGPSKTGDIEMKLVTGVHGPKHLHALLLEDL